MLPSLQFWANANITTSVLLPLTLALQTTKTTTRPLSDFPLRGPLTSSWFILYEFLSRPQQEFLQEYVLLIIPAVFIMVLSLCSMINQQFPLVFTKFHEVKRPVGGIATSLFFTAYCGEVVLYARETMVHPTKLVLNPYFPVHTWVSLVGLAGGLHVLGILHTWATTVSALLELVGCYLSALCGVLAASISSTSDANNLSFALYLLSGLLACITLQAIGLSCGVSLFHELGVISARCFTKLKVGVFFITGYCDRGFHQLIVMVMAVFREIYDFIGAVITRIRSGDRVSRFIKSYIIQPLIPFQRCVHLLVSFALFYSWQYTKRLTSSVTQKILSLWAQFVYWLIETVRTLVNDFIFPTCCFIYSEIAFIVRSISEVIVLVLMECRKIWLVVLYDCVVPLCRMLYRQAVAALRLVVDGFCQLMRTVYRGGNYMLHDVVFPLLRIAVDWVVTLCTTLWRATSRLCSIAVYDGAFPLGRAMRRALVRVMRCVDEIGRRILHFCQRFCLFLVNNVIKPAARGLRWLVIATWRGLVMYIARPAQRIVQRVTSFLWHYLFGILLLCFGSKFCWTSGEAVLRMVSTQQMVDTTGTRVYNMTEALGLLLGGYVCLIAGALLLVSKCRPFNKQQELIVFLTRCYYNLDFGLLVLINGVISRCQRISASTFRSVTKFISVVWKAGFDVLDFAFTFAVDFTRSLSLTLYTFTIKPLWQFVSRGVSVVWNSPYTSFAASCATIAIAFLCHANNINVWMKLLSLYSTCENLISSVVHCLQFHSLFEIDGQRLFQSVNDARSYALTITKFVASDIPLENIWLTAVNQSLWKLSEVPSLGWTLYIIHLGGGLTSFALAADPKVFVRGIMKVIYYPLIFSFVMSFVPSLGVGRFINISFGKMYALFTMLSAVVLLMEMQRLRSVPNVREWNVARRHRQARTRAEANSSNNASRVNVDPSAPPEPRAAAIFERAHTRVGLRPSAPPAPKEAPFEYLKHQARPRVVFEGTECPICFDELSSASKSTNDNRTDLCLPCGHVYHTDCVFDWLRDQPHCPSCRQVVPSQSTGPLLSPANIIQEVFL